MNRLHNEPGLWPLFFVIPAAVILAIGFLTGLIDFTPGTEKIMYAGFFPVELIELIFIPLSIISVLIFVFGLKRFIKDMNDDYQQRGLIQPEGFALLDYLTIYSQEYFTCHKT